MITLLTPFPSLGEVLYAVTFALLSGLLYVVKFLMGVLGALLEQYVIYPFCLFVIYGFIILFGMCIGSFLNVVIYRLPNGISIADGHSFCPVCRQKIKYRDLVPVFSFLFLGGKCRNCKSKISWRYPFVELFCGLLALFCTFKFGFSLKSFLVFAFLCVLVCVFFIDIDTMTIPDELIIFLLPLCAIFSFYFRDISLYSRLIGLFCISSLLLAINTFIKKDSFGGGDIKLIGVCGYILGWQNTLLAFFISLISATIVSIYLLSRSKKGLKSYIPFGPHLCLGIVISFFCGSELISLYLSMFNF